MEKWKLRDKTTERRIVSCLTKKSVILSLDAIIISAVTVFETEC